MDLCFCRAQKVFDQCLKPFEANCSMEQMIFFEVIDSLYDYICNQSFEGAKIRTVCELQGCFQRDAKAFRIGGSFISFQPM